MTPFQSQRCAVFLFYAARMRDDGLKRLRAFSDTFPIGSSVAWTHKGVMRHGTVTRYVDADRVSVAPRRGAGAVVVTLDNIADTIGRGGVEL